MDSYVAYVGSELLLRHLFQFHLMDSPDSGSPVVRAHNLLSIPFNGFRAGARVRAPSPRFPFNSI